MVEVRLVSIASSCIPTIHMGVDLEQPIMVIYYPKGYQVRLVYTHPKHLNLVLIELPLSMLLHRKPFGKTLIPSG